MNKPTVNNQQSFPSKREKKDIPVVFLGDISHNRGRRINEKLDEGN
jgi:hypothetical protein